MNHTSSTLPDVERHLHQAQRRTVQYWFEDGLAELVIGGSFFLMGLSFALIGAVARPRLLTLLPPALMLGFVLAGPRLIKKGKERLVYPRTGYVSFARPPRRRRFLAPVVGLVTASLFIALVGRRPSLEVWVPAILGLIMAGAFLRMNRSAQLDRLSFLAGVSALTGLAISLRGDSGNLAGGIYFAIIGLIMTTGGAFALRRYLRLAPKPEGA